MAGKRIVIALVAFAVLVGGAMTARILFFGNAPEEASLSTASAGAQGTVAYEGTWTVDPSFGEFSVPEARFTSTWAGYRISEEFAGLGTNTAVGRTRDVEGTMTISGNSISAVEIAVDMTTLRSDRDRRDNALRTRGLESDRFPTATFELTEPIEIDEEPDAGENIDTTATGNLTLHGVTKQVTAPIKGRRDGDRITIVSSFEVDLDDYRIERPTTARVVSIADKGKVEMQVHFTKSS
jgi:polyisoprenoid-binding protein YceI